MRTKEAFLFSCRRLLAETGELYSWTFTFREVPESDDWAMGQWAAACKNSQREFKGVHGLRVIELHRSHGMHFHLLLNQRFSVERMMRIFWPHGFGRIHVEKADLNAAGYLAKYLGKRFKERMFVGRRRLWAAFGGFKACRNMDVEYDGPFQRNKALLAGLRFACQGNRAVAYHALMACSSFGDWCDWPNGVKLRFLQIVRGCNYIWYDGMANREEYRGRPVPGTVDLARMFPAAQEKPVGEIDKVSVDKAATLCESDYVLMRYFDTRANVVRTECASHEKVYELCTDGKRPGGKAEIECPF